MSNPPPSKISQPVFYPMVLGKRKRGATTTRRPRRGYRRRAKRIGRPSRGLRQSRYLFKRTTIDRVTLGGSPGAGFAVSDNGIYKHWQFTIGDTGVNAGNLLASFQRYRINAVQVKMMFSNTVSGTHLRSDAAFDNSQILVYTTPNRVGTSAAPTEIEILNKQAKKVRLGLNGGKPLNFFMKLNQLSEVYASSTNTDYTTTRPQFIGTAETTAPHYGLTMFLKRASSDGLGAGLGDNQEVSIQTTYYLEFAGAK